MSDFVLTCESAADRTREFFESRNIPVVCFHYEIDDVVYTDDLYQSITPDEFFAKIAAGVMPKTSQLSAGEYEEFWEPLVAEGKDVLHLTLSSGISGTYGSACVAAQMLADRYPQGGKVRVIDSLAASSGFGLLAECAADVRDSGGFTRRDGCLDRGAQAQPSPLVLLDRSVELPARRSHFGCERNHRHGA